MKAHCVPEEKLGILFLGAHWTVPQKLLDVAKFFSRKVRCLLRLTLQTLRLSESTQCLVPFLVQLLLELISGGSGSTAL